jgi:Uma2 family endonuclease
MAQITQERVTADEFFKLPETNKLVELLNGEIVTQMPPIDIHQEIAALLHLLLAKLIPGGILRFAPLGVRLDDENVPEPDLFWVAGSESRAKKGKDGQWYGAPDLVVEILSPSTARYDRKHKYQLYEKHGVREYWIADPNNKSLEVWVLENNQFKHFGIYFPGDTFESPVLGGQKVDVQAAFAVEGSQE